MATTASAPSQGALVQRGEEFFLLLIGDIEAAATMLKAQIADAEHAHAQAELGA